MTRRVLAALLCGLLAGCAARHSSAGPAYLLKDKPPMHRQSIARHLVDVTLVAPIKAFERPAPSANLAAGQVPDSSFFTNRRIADLSAEQIRLGPTRPDQQPTPPFAVTKIKGEGKTAGFFVKDAKGDRYLIKLDLPEHPELLTGAEVAASKLMHALGYYVPSYEIIEFSPSDLVAAPDRDVKLEELQATVLTERLRNGRIRACASRLLDGEILGPFRFQDYRQLTELRALHVAYAWINNTDAKDHNSLMVWTGDRAIGYLIDFGTSFGADAKRGAKRPCQGWLNDVDLKHLTMELVTLSLHKHGCDVSDPTASPEVGLFSARLDPAHWKPYAPNLAFEAMTRADAEWMARRIGEFSRAQIEAAVSAGKYTDPADAARIVDTLEARRQAILHAYLPASRVVVSPTQPPTNRESAP